MKQMLSILFLFIFILSKFSFSGDLENRAVGYSIAGPLKTTILNNGNLSYSHPQGLYRNLQYLSNCSFILGVAGKDLQGNPHPWAIGKKYLYDRESQTYKWYGSDTTYWGPTVSESWMDRTTYLSISDWEADSLSTANLFSGVPACLYFPSWTYPENEELLLPHSNLAATFGVQGWPGFWATDINGNPVYGKYVSDQDIYFEMDDRFATRDIDSSQGYPLNVKVKTMASAYNNLPHGIIFFKFRLINQSSYHYKDLYSGFYFDADIYNRLDNGSYIGRTNDDDMMRFNLQDNTAYIWDLDDRSGDFSGDELSVLGITVLETPPASIDIDFNKDGIPEIKAGQPMGLSGWHWFDWYFRPGARDGSPNSGPWTGDGQTPCSEDREEIQYKILAGDTSNLSSYNDYHYFHPDASGKLNPHFDSWSALESSYSNGLDCVFMISSGPFELAPGDSADLLMALVAAPDTSTLIHNAQMAKYIYNQSPVESISIISGLGGEIYDTYTTFSWETESAGDSLDLYLSFGNNIDWHTLTTGLPNIGSYQHSVDDFQESAFYRLFIFSQKDGSLVYGQSDDFFSINHPGQADPEIYIQNPNAADTLQGIVPLEWIAGDADGDSMFISIEMEVMSVGGSSRRLWLIQNRPTKRSDYFNLDCSQYFGGDVKLNFYITDSFGNNTLRSVDNLTLKNDNQAVTEKIFIHSAGWGSAHLELKVSDGTKLTGHNYRMTFQSDSLDKYTTIYDMDAKQVLAEKIGYVNKYGFTNFDGISLEIYGYETAVVDSSYWLYGAKDWTFITKKTYPNRANYNVIFDTMGVDTSLNGNPLPFRVYNTSYASDSAIAVYFFDSNEQGVLDESDVFYFKEAIIDGIPQEDTRVTYGLQVINCSGIAEFQPGDIFRTTTLHFFNDDDTVYFQVPDTYQDIVDEPLQIPQQLYLAQNYPNPFNPNTTITFSIPQSAPVRLTIYDVLGRKVRTLMDGRYQAGIHLKNWDGCNDKGILVSSGIYFYKLAYGQKQIVKKMLMLR